MPSVTLVNHRLLILLLFCFAAACRPTPGVETASPTPADLEVVPATGTAVVITDVTALREMPDTQSVYVATVARGTALTVVGKVMDESWYQVELPEAGETVIWVQVPEGVTAVWIAAVFVELSGTEASSTPESTATLPVLSPSAPTSTSTASVTATTSSTPALTTTPCGRPPGWVTYVVQPGDILGRLAQAVGSTAQQLMLANCLTSDLILAGQELYVPRLPPISPDTPTFTATPGPPDTPTSTNTPIIIPPPSDTPTQTITPAFTQTPTPSEDTPVTREIPTVTATSAP